MYQNFYRIHNTYLSFLKMLVIIYIIIVTRLIKINLLIFIFYNLNNF